MYLPESVDFFVRTFQIWTSAFTCSFTDERASFVVRLLRNNGASRNTCVHGDNKNLRSNKTPENTVLNRESQHGKECSWLLTVSEDTSTAVLLWRV